MLLRVEGRAGQGFPMHGLSPAPTVYLSHPHSDPAASQSAYSSVLWSVPTSLLEMACFPPHPRQSLL